MNGKGVNYPCLIVPRFLSVGPTGLCCVYIKLSYSRRSHEAALTVGVGHVKERFRPLVDKECF